MVSTSSTEEIGRKIRMLRRSKDMTQEELGNKIGVTKATINKYETGVVNFPRDRIAQLSEVLDVSPSYLLGWEDQIAELNKLEEIYKQDLYLARAKSMLTGEPDKAETENLELALTKIKEKELHAEAVRRSYDSGITFDYMADELMRIYKSLSVKNKNDLLHYAFKLEESEHNQ